MESKHKNALIGALLAVVFVMAVGYAAFAQTLTINSTANITEEKTNWNVHFDTSKKESSGAVVANMGTGGATPPAGTIEYDDEGHTATLNATLNQPGDTVEFTLTIMNEGNVTAILDEPKVTANGGGEDTNPADLVVKKGNIIFTVTPANPDSIAKGATATMTVTATFDGNAQSVGSVTESSISVTTLAHQAE